MLPEEPKDIRAVYVSDMGKAATWEEPGASNWVDARRASFVIGSRMKGGMGADEAVPFSDRSAAEKFASENGGRVVAFAEVPKDYILGGAAAPAAAEEGEPALDDQQTGSPVTSAAPHTHPN
jgi:copper chaperone NosL